MWKLWLIVSGLSFVIEAITVGFLVFWFGIGALLAMITSFFTDNVFIQSTIFLVSSTLLLFLTRPFLKKFPTKKNISTNVYSIIGKEALVIEDIDTINNKGLIKINGETWSAKYEYNKIISKGSKVEIVSVDGVKAFVKPLKSPAVN